MLDDLLDPEDFEVVDAVGADSSVWESTFQPSDFQGNDMSAAICFGLNASLGDTRA